MIKQYRGLDLYKFICAIFIILLHTSPLGSYSTLLSLGIRHVLTTVAVPSFFIISGFLFCEKIASLPDQGAQNAYFKKYILRLVTLYLIWSAIYFVFVVIKWLRRGFEFSFVLIYIKDFFFEGSYLTIWFLPALLSAVAFVFLLHKRLSYRTIFLIGLGVYAVTLLGTAYYGLSEKLLPLKAFFEAYYSIFDTMKNGVFFGFVYVALGGVLSEYKEKIRLSRLGNVVLIALLWLALAAEQLLRGVIGGSKSSDTMLMLIPLCFFLCAFFMNLPLGESSLWARLRKYSMGLFLCQRIPMSIIELFLADTPLYTNSLIFFAVVLSVSLLLSALIIEGSKKIKILKHLY